MPAKEKDGGYECIRVHPSQGLINKSRVKTVAMELCKATGRTKFTRVSASFLSDCEVNLYLFIKARIHSHPSKGKTLQGMY